MSHDKFGPLGSIVLHPNLPFLQSWAHQHQRTGHLRHRTEPLGVRNRLNLVEQFQVGEIVHEYLLLQNDDDSVPAEANGPDNGAERELANASALVIVPNHDLVGGVLRVGPTADYGQDIAAEKHLHDANSAAVVEVPAEELAERVAVVDPEPVVRPHGEAGVVLIEREVEQRRRRT